MKVIQIVPSIANESSGPSYSVPALCNGLKTSGCDVSLHVISPLPTRKFDFPVIDYPATFFPHPRLGRSPSMLSGLMKAAQSADIIHNSSLWMFPNVYGWRVVDKLRKNGNNRIKLVNQPRGAMSAWALKHHHLRKHLFGRLAGQYAAMAATDMWLATADSEADEIRALGYKQPICILPNGVDLPQASLYENIKPLKNRRLYFLSRIHEKKNVQMLIEVWAELEKDFPDWSLSIVGPDLNNEYADAMKALAIKLGCKRVVFEGELSGEEKYRFMAESDCMVLPTHSENFGMVVAESLVCGTPVICSRGAPWGGLEINGAGWWIDAKHDAFLDTMRNVMRMDRSSLKAMGAAGRQWMQRDFSWNGIGEKLHQAYAWLLNPSENSQPEFVRYG